MDDIQKSIQARHLGVKDNMANMFSKGRALPIGTIKRRPNGNFIKTASGWKYHSSHKSGDKQNKDVKKEPTKAPLIRKTSELGKPVILEGTVINGSEIGNPIRQDKNGVFYIQNYGDSSASSRVTNFKGYQEYLDSKSSKAKSTEQTVSDIKSELQKELGKDQSAEVNTRGWGWDVDKLDKSTIKIFGGELNKHEWRGTVDTRIDKQTIQKVVKKLGLDKDFKIKEHSYKPSTEKGWNDTSYFYELIKK